MAPVRGVIGFDLTQDLRPGLSLCRPSGAGWVDLHGRSRLKLESKAPPSRKMREKDGAPGAVPVIQSGLADRGPSTSQIVRVANYLLRSG